MGSALVVILLALTVAVGDTSAQAPPLPNLEPRITAPDWVAAERSFTYTIVVGNASGVDANGVTAMDTLPAGVTLLSPPSFTSPAGAGTCTGASTFTCLIGDLAHGLSATITARVMSPTVTAPTPIRNSVAVTWNPGGLSSMDSSNTQVIPPTDVSIIKTHSPEPSHLQGLNPTFSLAVTNNSNWLVRDMRVSDTLDSRLGYVGASSACSAPGMDRVVNCSIAFLSSHSTVTLTITVTPTTTGVISNLAQVQWMACHGCTETAPDPNAGNDRWVDNITVNPAQADLSVTKVRNLASGFTVTVTNNGPSSATGIVATETIPPGIPFLRAYPSQGSCRTRVVTGRSPTTVLVCDFGRLGFRASARVAVFLGLPTSGTVVDTASVRGNEPDPNPANNTFTLTTVLP